MYLLDHLVHFVDKPEHLVEASKGLGMHTVNGGKHEMWGTYNSLCYMGLSYIEFIGIFDQDLFEKSAQAPFTLHETYKNRDYQNGIVRIALRTNTIEDDVEKIKSLGYDVYGPAEFSRRRPDGSFIKWKLLHFGRKNQSIEFPFLIQWHETDDERYTSLVETGTIQTHPVGNLQVKELQFEVEDLTTAVEWGKVFDFKINEATDAFMQLDIPNCLLTFKQVKGSSKISQIIISGSKEEKETVIEGTKYLFLK